MEPILKLIVSDPTMIRLENGHSCQIVTLSNLAKFLKKAVCTNQNHSHTIDVNVQYLFDVWQGHSIMITKIEQPEQITDNNNQRLAI